MPLDTAALSLQADALAEVATVLRLHSDDPGTGNSNTTSDGDQTVTLTSEDGDLSVSDVKFTGGTAGGAVKWCTLWNAAKDTRYGKFQLTGDQAFNAAGEYTVDSLTLDSSSS